MVSRFGAGMQSDRSRSCKPLEPMGSIRSRSSGAVHRRGALVQRAPAEGPAIGMPLSGVSSWSSST